MCLAITSHYIDDNFNLHQPLLSFQYLEEHHSGPYLARIILDVLNEYDLCDKLFCITTDNASNNDTIVRTLETLLERDGVSWDSTANHIRCLTHVINLVVISYLDNLKINELSITTFDKLRTVAKAVRSSSSRWEEFKSCCLSYNIKPITIPLDVRTHWNSTYRILSQSVYLCHAIHRFIDDHEKLADCKLNDDEWDLTEVLLVFLMPFQRCTLRFECNNVTLEIDYVFFAYDSIYNHIDDVKAALSHSEGIRLLSCASEMLTSLEEMENTLKTYYSRTQLSQVYGDAMILNPRCKLAIFEEESWEDEDPEKYISACRHRFFEGYPNSENPSYVSAAEQSRTPCSENVD